MDKIVDKGKSMMSGNKGSSAQKPAGGLVLSLAPTSPFNNADTSCSATGGQDYGDKGVNAVEKKFGFDQSGKYDVSLADPEQEDRSFALPSGVGCGSLRPCLDVRVLAKLCLLVQLCRLISCLGYHRLSLQHPTL